MLSMHHTRPAAAHRGVTLVELLIASIIMTMLAAALGTMANAVYQSTEYGHGYGAITQHARVVSERINAMVAGATASAEFPGALVLEEFVTGQHFPDVLVVWSPTGAAVNPNGKPRVNELVVYRYHPTRRHELIELRDPNNSAVAPDVSASSAWRSTVDAMLASNTRIEVVLTDLLRVAVLNDGSALNGKGRRGCVRFQLTLRPSQDDWDRYKSGTLAWQDIPWAQSIHGSQTGLRQTWVRYELQLKPPVIATDADNDDALPPKPFFGSAAVYYELHR